MANGIRGLLGDPRFNLGLGLLAAGGPSREPTSLGQNMAQATQFAAERDRQAMENRAVRQELQARQRRQEAQQELRGLLGSQEMIRGPGQEVTGIGGENIGSIPGRVANVPTISTPQGQQRAMGLLAEASPEQFSSQLSSGLLGQMFGGGQERAEPAPVRIARVLADPNESQEVKDAIQAQIDRSDIGAQLQNQLRALQAEQINREMENARTEEERNRLATEQSLVSGVDRITELIEINNRLKNTAGETGLGLEELKSRFAGPFSAVVSLFGGDREKARQVAADIQRFEQLTTTEAVRSLFSGELQSGQLTNAKMNTFIQTKPGLDKLPEVNNRQLADMLREKLNVAERVEFSIPGERNLERLIEQTRSGEFSPGSPQVGSDEEAAPATGEAEGPPMFRSEAEAERALRNGRINVGDVVVINGQRMRATE